VEFRPASLHALKANVAALKLRERTRIFKKDAMVFILGIEPSGYDIAFADPPYTSRLLERVLDLWREHRFARILAVEHAASNQLPPGAHRKRFEESAITVYRS
jgi:16S rRNA (guanine966-N2)-methyltransferase